ncbi:MAG TPA: nucleotidyltransferase domain-containing protein [Coleofasciculaceae cyanobacterium]|jgi:predicted nucleotidyltransferase
MADITLCTSTTVPKVDQIVREIINLVECYFRDRIRGYYLVGSYALGEAVATSDLDMVVVFKDSFKPEEKKPFAQVLFKCNHISPLHIDLTPVGEAMLFRVGGVRFQKASLLMYGEDIRAAVPIKPIENHIRETMHDQYRLFARVRGNPSVLTFPLDYPDPDGEFYGYDCRLMRTADGMQHPGIKDLVLNVLCPATALVLLKAGKYVGNGKRSDCGTQYRVWINDEWTAFIEAVDEYCRKRWTYLVPEDKARRQLLRSLCERALGFENHFLMQYKDYLLTQLRQVEPFIQLHYVKRLGQLLYPDQAVIAALQDVGNSSNPEIRQAVSQTLRKYAKA